MTIFNLFQKKPKHVLSEYVFKGQTWYSVHWWDKHGRVSRLASPSKFERDQWVAGLKE